MARIINKNIIGALGPAVFSVHRGTNTLRGKPGPIKQSESTKKAANRFGEASKFAGHIRNHLQYKLKFTADADMINRLNRQMGVILRRHLDQDTGNYDFHTRTFKSLNGFEFNMKSQLKELLWTLPETRLMNGKLRVTLPEMEIKKNLHFPENANSCTVFLSVHYGSLKTEDEKIGSHEMNPIMEISRDHSHTTKQEWTYDIPEGCYVITSIALHYHDKWDRYQLSVNTPEMSPAMICDVSVNPGKFPGRPNRGWARKNFSFADEEPETRATESEGNDGSDIAGKSHQSAQENASAPQTCCIYEPLSSGNPFIDISPEQIPIPDVTIQVTETRPQYAISKSEKESQEQPGAEKGTSEPIKNPLETNKVVKFKTNPDENIQGAELGIAAPFSHQTGTNIKGLTSDKSPSVYEISFKTTDQPRREPSASKSSDNADFHTDDDG
ncbi:hypothetical protein [Pedobacter sp. BAL39]|uniref:hypothetical protein n=1 Tax=Pedobacter sp. BAL39 TaxID=391596 RepID=UPI0002F13B8F|nr:hypothetical protein [Pedobacter sp. BAL39]